MNQDLRWTLEYCNVLRQPYEMIGLGLQNEQVVQFQNTLQISNRDKKRKPTCSAILHALNRNIELRYTR